MADEIKNEATEAVEETVEATATDAKAKKAKGGKKKLPIILGVVVVVIVAAGAGFWVWHEQPSFCNAICQLHLLPPSVSLGPHLPPSALPLCSTPAPLLCNIPTSPLNSPLLHSFYTPDFTTQLPHLLHSFYTPCFTTPPPCSATPRHEPESAHYAALRADATPFASGCRSCTLQRLYP